MRKLLALPVLVLVLSACGSSQLGNTRDDVLRDVDVENITSEREMTFGSGMGGGYSSFGEFAEDKIATGGEWTPSLGSWDDELKSRSEVSFTTVSEREYNEEARRYDPSTATVWYFWDEEDRCIAILREPWN